MLYSQESEIIQEMRTLMNKISEKVRYFNDLYQANYRGKITKDEMMNGIREKISTFSDIELEEYNEMCKMFSETNCEWSEYEVGEIIHNEIIKIWYPDKSPI